VSAATSEASPGAERSGSRPEPDDVRRGAPDLARGVALLRPRSAWEAVDFGFAFARPLYARMLVASALVVLPISTLLLLLRVPAEWVALAAWWTKPAWERISLHVLSRSLFGERPTVRETLRALPRYVRRDLLAWLTIRRPSPTRAFDLPVTQLEGASGVVRAQRLELLHRGRFTGASVLLLVFLAHLELALLVAIALLAAMLVPDPVDFDVMGWLFQLGDDAAPGASVALSLLSVLVSLAVAPFHVAGGFALYLHRRVDLEAWDLELAFRRLAARLEGRPSHPIAQAGRTIGVVVVLGLALGLAGPIPTHAEGLDPATARSEIAELLADEAFHRIETISVPRFLLDRELDDEEDDGPTAFAAWLEAFAERFAEVAEVGLVAAALGFLGWLSWRILRSREGVFGGSRRDGRARRVGAPRELFGLELAEETLPDDLAAAARTLLARGERRAALALLYRGALSRAGSLHGIQLSRGGTERECVDVVRAGMSEDGGRYFASLTDAWVRCAYGQIEPDPTLSDGLCGEWSRWFAPGGGDA